jgi:hypothetical protein
MKSALLRGILRRQIAWRGADIVHYTEARALGAEFQYLIINAHRSTGLNKTAKNQLREIPLACLRSPVLRCSLSDSFDRHSAAPIWGDCALLFASHNDCILQAANRSGIDGQNIEE